MDTRIFVVLSIEVSAAALKIIAKLSVVLFAVGWKYLILKE